LNLFSYVGGNPTRYSDPSGLVTYQCRRPLGGKPGKNLKVGVDVPWNPFFHQYTCTTNSATGTLQCSSTTAGAPGPKGFVYGPGKPTGPSTDYYNPNACEQTLGNNKCFERCLIDEWAKPRPPYGNPIGINCQQYDNSVNETCRAKCGVK
jgi:hypothetical protein